MTTQDVHLAVIGVNSRMRKLDRAKVKQLADSITEIGLLHPVTLCAAGNEFTLVAGRHRLEAARALGWHTIAATVVEMADADRRLAEIDENLIRNELSDLERSEHLSSRKAWYDAKHPETVNPNKRGGPGRGNKTVADSAVVSFSADTADKTGLSERTIRQDVQIAESIPEDVRDAIRETPLADSKTDLLAIARLPEDKQREVIKTADLTSKASVRAAVAERQGFTCRSCGQEQTVKVWHCDSCGEHWLPGDPCGDCPPKAEPTPDESLDTSVVIQPTVDAFVAAIFEHFTDSERAQIAERITPTQSLVRTHASQQIAAAAQGVV